MTRTDHIALLDEVTEMLEQVGEFIDRTKNTAGEAALTDEETKLAKDLRTGLDKLAKLSYTAAAVSYRTRDDRRIAGDTEQAEFTTLVMPVKKPKWYKAKRAEECTIAEGAKIAKDAKTKPAAKDAKKAAATPKEGAK